MDSPYSSLLAFVSDVDSNRNPNRTAKSRLENAAVQNQFVYAQMLAIEVRTKKADLKQTRFFVLTWLPVSPQSYRNFLGEALRENFPDLAPHLDTPRKELAQSAPDVLCPSFRLWEIQRHNQSLNDQNHP